MFLNNKYNKWYFELINKRKLNPVVEGYSEKHHIIPSSLGGTNNSDNIVSLSAREHYLAHLLLARMTTGPSLHKMIRGAWLMSCPTMENRDYKINSRIYETLRINHAKLNGDPERRKKTSESMKKYQATNPWTPEKRERQRIITIERMKAAGKWKKKVDQE